MTTGVRLSCSDDDAMGIVIKILIDMTRGRNKVAISNTISMVNSQYFSFCNRSTENTENIEVQTRICEEGRMRWES